MTIESETNKINSDELVIAQKKPVISPVARNVYLQSGRPDSELANIVGTGHNGRVMKIDVENYLQQTQADVTSETAEFTEALTLDPQAEINEINQLITAELIKEGVPEAEIAPGEIRNSTVLYMIYWFDRLKNNRQEQQRIKEYLINYIGTSVADSASLVEKLFSNVELVEAAKKYAENLLVPMRTVDLVVTTADADEKKDKAILCLKRTYHPTGLALPGGFINDTDEDNVLDAPPEIFAALRVAGEKVLGLNGKARYEKGTDSKGKPCFMVRGETDKPVVYLYDADQSGYHFRENLKTTLRPSDPRHIVDTLGFKCVIEGDINNDLIWKNKSELMSTDTPNSDFAFGHHREIISYITSKTSLEKEKEMKERDFVRKLIDQPLESYLEMKARFAAEGNSPEVSMPELFPVVDKILTEMFSPEINEMCAKNRLLIGIRDKAVITLRQVTLKNRVFCPYLSTLNAITDGVAFFDLIAREKKGFYETVPPDKIIEHNPRETKYASYHMYRYQYRFNMLRAMIPNEIIIPTFEPLSATDLLKVRGVPIRFVGVATDFLYVDEFEQSPEEFFMHDVNHSWRMSDEDKKAGEKYGKTSEELLQESNAFIKEYMAKIKILKTDTEEQREIKKLKKIILFEIVHEDARPFLKEVIARFIQQKEGGTVSFEVPRIDPESGYMDIVDTLDTGISTLSYVRNKLQHGFYDQVDAQLPQIVSPKYRTARWITKAAYEMLIDLDAKPEPEAELDDEGHVSFMWLLQRTCSPGPDNVHDASIDDEDVAKFGENDVALNPKRYQA